MNKQETDKIIELIDFIENSKEKCYFKLMAIHQVLKHEILNSLTVEDSHKERKEYMESQGWDFGKKEGN